LGFVISNFALTKFLEKTGICFPTGTDKDNTLIYEPKAHFASILKSIQEIDLKHLIETKLNATLGSDANTTTTITTAQLAERLQGHFFECQQGQGSIPYLSKITTCVQSQLKASPSALASPWKQISCPDVFYTKGIAKQKQTCGESSIQIAVQKRS
jgi:hypothetical protein